MAEAFAEDDFAFGDGGVASSPPPRKSRRSRVAAGAKNGNPEFFLYNDEDWGGSLRLVWWSFYRVNV